ncbi:Serine protease Do-like HtrB [Botrimarina colliarenosi]|uniref:Serine protease Do-like HtrB n=1 Tax=Botrimarina colliarenosi TaxID=2528001 RepID=A0A5C6ACU6_9BACT|nr:S1C family serine protease [Botrimarina colliarenosi]TWT96093.1 Serine protease Do-like HtrB [Botrimarina colliarenosi]
MRVRSLAACLGLLLCHAMAFGATSSPDAEPLQRAQLAIAKLYGAGRVAGLEGYQTGGFFPGSPVLVVTADSAALDGGRVTLVDAYGERCEARVTGRDASTGLVLLECPESYEAPSHFQLAETVTPRPAQRVWALSNCFGVAAGDELVTVQRGRIAALAPMPTATDPEQYRPTLGVPEPGATVLMLDAVTSNPGAAGGVVVDTDGVLLGVLGAECQSPTTGAWINYALPVEAVNAAIERIRAGSAPDRDPLRDAFRTGRLFAHSGLGLIPRINARTPAYVERVEPGSPADNAGCEPDDLIVAVDGATVGAVDSATAAIERGFTRRQTAVLTLLRGEQLVTITLRGDAP